MIRINSKKVKCALSCIISHNIHDRFREKGAVHSAPPFGYVIRFYFTLPEQNGEVQTYAYFYFAFYVLFAHALLLHRSISVS